MCTCHGETMCLVRWCTAFAVGHIFSSTPISTRGSTSTGLCSTSFEHTSTTCIVKKILFILHRPNNLCGQTCCEEHRVDLVFPKQVCAHVRLLHDAQFLETRAQPPRRQMLLRTVALQHVGTRHHRKVARRIRAAGHAHQGRAAAAHATTRAPHFRRLHRDTESVPSARSLVLQVRR